MYNSAFVAEKKGFQERTFSEETGRAHAVRVAASRPENEFLKRDGRELRQQLSLVIESSEENELLDKPDFQATMADETFSCPKRCYLLSINSLNAALN